MDLVSQCELKNSNDQQFDILISKNQALQIYLKHHVYYISEGSVSHINGVRPSFLEITAVSRKGVTCA